MNNKILQRVVLLVLMVFMVGFVLNTTIGCGNSSSVQDDIISGDGDGDGDGDPSPVPDPVPDPVEEAEAPTASLHTPATITNVDRDIDQIIVNFSEQMNVEVLPGNAARLADSLGDAIIGTYAFNADGMSLVFDISDEVTLDPFSTYTITISALLEGLDGNTMSVDSDLSWNFTTEHGFEDVITVGVAAAEDDVLALPKVAVDPDGNAMIVYRSTRPIVGTDIYFQRYYDDMLEEGYDSYEINELAPDADTDINLAKDANGNFIANWITGGVLVNTSYFNASEPDLNARWQEEVTLNVDNALDVITPRLAMSSDGYAISYWIQGTHIALNAFDDGSWLAEEQLLDDLGIAPATDYKTISFDMNDNHDWTLIWKYDSGVGTNDIDALRFEYNEEGGAISTQEIAVNVLDEDYLHTDVAIDNNGNTYVIWEEDGDIFARQYNNELAEPAWLDPIGVEEGEDATLPKIAVGNNGDIVAMSWLRDSSIMGSVLPELVATDLLNDSPAVSDFSIATNNNMSVIVFEAEGRIYVNFYNSEDGWLEDSIYVSTGTTPSVDINEAGVVFVTWREDGNIMARVYR